MATTLLNRKTLATGTWIVAFSVLLFAGCSRKPPEPEAARPTQQRTDFAPEDFGVGRPHTRNASCNRQIDRLLDEVRLCFNSGKGPACDPLQQDNSGRIERIKNSAACRH